MAPAEEDRWVGEILALIRKRTPFDFSTYKAGTARRRIERRSNLAQLDSLARY